MPVFYPRTCIYKCFSQHAQLYQETNIYPYAISITQSHIHRCHPAGVRAKQEDAKAGLL